MAEVSYAKRGLKRNRLTIDDILNPSEDRNNFAVFGGTEQERISVMLLGIRRSISNRAVIILHDSTAFEDEILHTFQPITRIDVGMRSFDPLYGIDRSDALRTRTILNGTIRARGMAMVRVSSNDAALQRMLASELLGISYSGEPFLLVLFGVKQTTDGPFISMAIGDHGGNYVSAVSGASTIHTLSPDNMSDMLQSFNEVLFLPIEDSQEAQRISNCFGSYMRTYAQPVAHQHGIWPFGHRDRRLNYQQTVTNNINPQSLKEYSLVCGTAFFEPILVKRIDF